MSKKKWNLFENVFGKSKKSETKRRERLVQPQPREVQLLKNKRNSFSSPDLSHLDANYNNSGCSNCSFDLENPSNISASNSYELENLNEEAEHALEFVNDANISYKIKPNFELNLSNDISSVNLVGSNYHLSRFEDSSPKSQPASSPPGYLEMRPGRGFDMKKVEELDCQLKNDYLYRLKYSFDSPITYKREFDYGMFPPQEGIYINEKRNEPHYVCMTNGTKFSPKNTIRDEPTYMPMIRVPKVVVEEHPKCEIESTKISCKRHSVDDKIPSYYPNLYDTPSKCNGSTPLREVSVNKQLQKVRSSEPINNFKSSPLPIPPRKTKRVGSFNLKSINDNNNNNSDVKSPDISKKYATISRLTVKNSSADNTLSPSTIKKSGSISPTSIKRFTSLPRFKKIDFSPLRLKISSVLQRNNSGQC